MTTTRQTLPAPHPPTGWREDPDTATLRCPHRNLTVCADCATTPGVTEVFGVHYWDPTGEIAAELAEG